MDEKQQKSAVNYSEGGDHCGVCIYFNPPHTCMRVEGSIEEYMWCKLFKRRGDARGMSAKHVRRK